MELEAGIERLAQFGFMLTLDALCCGDALKYDAMLEKPAYFIYTKLLLDMETAKYKENMEAILVRNARIAQAQG